MLGEPQEGAFYVAKGFVFRVDFVERGEVYLVRWQECDGCRWGLPMRVDLTEWEKEMGQCQPITKTPREP